MSSDSPVFVLDNGSNTIKAGLSSGSEIDEKFHQTNVFPSILVGKQKHRYAHALDKILLEKYQQMTIASISHPIKRGKIRNFNKMEKLWSSIFKSLDIKPDNHGILLSETTLNTKKNREKSMEIMFEKFNVPHFMTYIQPVLTLASMGLLSGVVVQSGQVTNIVPIADQMCIGINNNNPKSTIKTIQQLPIGGSKITEYLGELLMESNRNKRKLKKHQYTDLFEKMKKAKCYVASSSDIFNTLTKQERHRIKQKYTLPDGKTIVMRRNRFKPCECLFNPSLIDIESNGLHKLIIKSIENCGLNIYVNKKELYKNIILNGGNTMFDGLSYRLKNEIIKINSINNKVKILEPDNKLYSTWIGGSILSSLSCYKRCSINQNEYTEYGSRILLQKCNYNVWTQN